MVTYFWAAVLAILTFLCIAGPGGDIGPKNRH
jgi:hypothetical protein